MAQALLGLKNFTKTLWRAELIWDFTRENSAVVNAFIKNKSVKGPAYTGSWTSTAKLHYHLHLTKRRDDETSNFSTRRADDWCHQQPRPPRFKTFSWPEDNSGSELCRIRFLSCCCLDLPHHHASHQPPLHHHKPWTMISGEIFGKMFINVWLQSCWKYRQCEYAKRQFFFLRLKSLE